ncbi:YceI family protein [Aliiglaciecola sp. LCG003]|uniref:YceI family protein n=1 Tax=Aliiglaciecola sp. LCG003 TaxID=3053655 RepID=UPI002573F870|nr:YceI family protein [Aliiglaciecola sp. LCG003]WJG08541.1 YceI family protein [Aliiglaciecola sp. LCG003]
MLKYLKLGTLLLSSALSLNLTAAEMTYQIDPTHTSIVASWSHFGFSNPTASLSGASGKIVFDQQAPEKSSITVTLPVTSIDTYVEKLTSEFLDKDYFDTSRFPDAKFVSTKVSKTGESTFDVVGELTIKGVTKAVVFHATLNKTGLHPMTQKAAIGFDAHAEIQRSDFGLAQYVPNVGDAVKITITTEAQVE